jgi:hypothetical protein
MSKRNITLLTMGAGNVIVLEETLKSFVRSGICNEVIYGDLLLFAEDREILNTYVEPYNVKIVPFQFNYIFKNGFASLLNELADKATNDLVIYMNTSEIISVDKGIVEAIENNPDCNTFYFDHATDPHRWYRCYNRHELKWSGMIHEEVIGEHKPYHKPIFTMADLEKDMGSSFKAKVFNDAKEIVYFQQYKNLIDYPERQGGTNSGWLEFAKSNYDSMTERLEKKGKRYQAFINGNLYNYLEQVYGDKEFEKERFESGNMIEFQGDPKFLGK